MSGRGVAKGALWAGLILAAGAPALAWALDNFFGRDVIYLSPHAPEIVRLNRFSWKAGDSVVALYGIPANDPIRVIFPKASRILIPPEDTRLTLLQVDKQAGENPLQAQTLWFFARWIGLAGAVVALLGGVYLGFESFGFFKR